MLDNTSHRIGGGMIEKFVVVVMSAALVAALSTEMQANPGICQQGVGVNASGYCPQGKTYCSGFLLFCCSNGEIIGPCIGVWGCRAINEKLTNHSPRWGE